MAPVFVEDFAELLDAASEVVEVGVEEDVGDDDVDKVAVAVDPEKNMSKTPMKQECALD